MRSVNKKSNPIKHALSLILILFLPFAAFSEQIIIPLDYAVKHSDIIVIGTLRDVSEETKDGIDYGNGEINIEEVLWGKLKPDQKLRLVWQNESFIDCPRVEHRDNSNKRFIWLLTLKSADKVEADNPGRVVSIEKKQEVVELIRKQKT